MTPGIAGIVEVLRWIDVLLDHPVQVGRRVRRAAPARRPVNYPLVDQLVKGLKRQIPVSSARVSRFDLSLVRARRAAAPLRRLGGSICRPLHPCRFSSPPLLTLRETLKNEYRLLYPLSFSPQVRQDLIDIHGSIIAQDLSRLILQRAFQTLPMMSLSSLRLLRRTTSSDDRRPRPSTA